MRKYNRNNDVVVFNTIQAYLKASRENLQRQLQLAQAEGWTLAIKLVRGAYIAHDIRSRIHDTKAETDRNYDGIVQRLISREYPLDEDYAEPGEQRLQESQKRPRPRFPDVRLFVASHNAESVRRAYALHRERVALELPTIPVQFGQLQGMADEISCELLAEGRRVQDQARHGPERAAAPQTFKCLAWGSLAQCLQFLLRRAVENKGTVQRTKHMADALRRELSRRIIQRD